MKTSYRLQYTRLGGLLALFVFAMASISTLSVSAETTLSTLATYTFSETSGYTIVDDAHGNHGGISQSVGRIAGPAGQAIRIHNASTVYVPNAPQLNVGTGDFSIALWLRTDDDGGVKRIFDKRVRSATLTGYHMYLWDGNLGFQLADGNGQIAKCKWDNAAPQCTNFTSSAFVADGKWHHVVVTIDRDQRGGMHFWVDGTQVAQFDPTGRPGSLDNAASWDVPLAMDAKGLPLDIDEFHIFDHVISAETIRTLSTPNP